MSKLSHVAGGIAWIPTFLLKYERATMPRWAQESGSSPSIMMMGPASLDWIRDVAPRCLAAMKAGIEYFRDTGTTVTPEDPSTRDVMYIDTHSCCIIKDQIGSRIILDKEGLQYLVDSLEEEYGKVIDDE